MGLASDSRGSASSPSELNNSPLRCPLGHCPWPALAFSVVLPGLVRRCRSTDTVRTASHAGKASPFKGDHVKGGIAHQSTAGRTTFHRTDKGYRSYTVKVYTETHSCPDASQLASISLWHL